MAAAVSSATTERNLADAFRQRNLNYNAIIFEQIVVANKAFEKGLCDTNEMIGDHSWCTNFGNGVAIVTVKGDLCLKIITTVRIPKPFEELKAKATEIATAIFDKENNTIE